MPASYKRAGEILPFCHLVDPLKGLARPMGEVVMSTYQFFDLTTQLEMADEQSSAALYYCQLMTDFLEKRGEQLQVFNLMSDPAAFLANERASQLLTSEGDAAFPLLLKDDELLLKSAYPLQQDWASWLGLPATDLPAWPSAEDVDFWKSVLSLSSGCGGCGGGCGGCGGGCGSHGAEEDDPWAELEIDLREEV